MADSKEKKTKALTKEVFEWAAKEIVNNKMFYESRPPWDSVVEFARALFKEFGANYDDNLFLHRLKELYEDDQRQ